MILERQLDILVFLYNSNDWITSQELSHHFKVNKKTVQNDIKMLAEYFTDGLIIRTNQSKGYFIEYISKKVRTILILEMNEKTRENSLLPQHSSIILYLLFLKNPITMQNLADLFFMSKAAINLELETLKRWIDRYEGINLEISRKKGVIVQADEKVKRRYCAKNGTVYAFKNAPFPNDLIEEYERYFFSIKKILADCCIYFKYILTGEELEKNTRFITISIIRSLMGYKIETRIDEKLDVPFIMRLATQVKNELEYELETEELSDIHRLLNVSDIIELEPKIDLDIAEKTEQFVKKSLTSIHVPEEYIANIDCSLLTQHMEKVVSRSISGEVAINHYNEKIGIRYPLEIHLVYMFLEQIFSVGINKESSFIALFLATYLREYKNRTRMLLVIDQNISIGQSIKSLFEEYESFHISDFTILPTYYYQHNESVKHDFDLLLTTNSEIVLSDSSFFLVPTIITKEEINSIYNSIRKKMQQNYEIKKNNIREKYLKEKAISETDQEYVEIVEMVENNRICTQHTFSKYNLFVCKAGNRGDNKIIIYHLNNSWVFKRKKIKRIFFVEYNRNNPDIFHFFSTVSEVLYSYS